MAVENLSLDGHFSAEVDRILRLRGMKRADLARSLGVTRAQVTQLLSGANSPTLRTVERVATALDATVTLSLRRNPGSY